MKRGHISEFCHPGVLALAGELEIPIVYAIGIIECLRLWCAEYIPKGRIGKYSNSEIACGVGFTADDRISPDVLIAAMCKTGWIAEDPTYRLIAHQLNWRGAPKYRRWQRMKAAGGEIAASIRAFVFARDCFQCLICGCESDLTIDHIEPVSRGGTNLIDNLQTLCRRCNGRKG